jgi:hypothetical protein
MIYHELMHTRIYVQIRTAIQSLPDIRGVQVSKATLGSVWSVTFLNDYPSTYNAKITIDTTGLVGSNSGSVSGTVVVKTPSMLPHGYNSDIVTAANGVLSYTYVIEGLQTGVEYYVAVSSLNSGGYSTAQQSVPQQLAPPEQKPSEPMEVYMVN